MYRNNIKVKKIQKSTDVQNAQNHTSVVSFDILTILNKIYKKQMQKSSSPGAN